MAIIRIKLSTVELVALCLSTVLQLVCFVAPGWWIYTDQYGGSTTYEALFYIIICKNVTGCETMSWHTYWSGERIPGFYGYAVRKQIFLIVALAATVACFVLHIVKRRRQIVTATLVAITTCSCMVGSGALMIWNLSDSYIQIHNSNQYPYFSATIGFPYCVMLYTIALIGNITVFVLFVVEVVREQRRQISQDTVSELTGLPTTSSVNTETGAYSRFS